LAIYRVHGKIEKDDVSTSGEGNEREERRSEKE
jgi:hypothetical protein